jgi:hypothetical protein
MKQILSSFDKSKLVFAIMLVIVLSGCQLLAPSTPTQVFPALFVPTPDCGAPTIVLGSTSFQVEMLTPGAGGSIAVPSGTSGIAYWVEGTDTNSVFVLAPTPENLAAMSTISEGSPVTVTWSNCNSATYALFAPQEGMFDASALPDQSVEGITVFFQRDASAASFVFSGDLIEEQISTLSTPIPEAGEIQAEVSLLGTTSSADGTTIKTGISILNYGRSALTLSVNDISLTEQDGTVIAMLSSEPALPKAISPGAIETIYFTFPRPGSPAATLKILSVEYDIEGY